MRSGVNKCLLLLLLWGFVPEVSAQIPVRFIQSDSLATRWDEAMPLGNGLIGALIWQKEQHIRLSLDRADLWDERPMKGLQGNHFRFQWVKEKWHSGQYDSVQKMLDHPYDREPAPTKIPGAALEMPAALLGAHRKVSLDLYTASVSVSGDKGASMSAFIEASRPYGWIRFKGVKVPFRPALIPPQYKGATATGGDVVGGDDLSRLGYTQGTVDSLANSYTYLQKGWNEFSYRVSIAWTQQADEVVLIWTIASSDNGRVPDNPVRQLKKLLALGYDAAFAQHQLWWAAHWAKSSIQIPDPVLLKQWYLTRYFMGAASRKGAPPISLQAVWTADNGRIPPWKGDYHHDLNTELSYWPFYAANDLEGASVFIDHLEKNKANYRRYTKSYFNVEGLNVPGVTTLKGTEMGGWIQYALSPTVSCWLAQHYEWQWLYSGDKRFLKQKAYPWFREVLTYIDNITYLDSSGERHLPLSSSPEFYDNSSRAWFPVITNYDLSLLIYTASRGVKLANALGYAGEARRWQRLADQLPDLAISSTGSLSVAEVEPYGQSHRHFSHLMAIYPLGLYTKEKDRPIIENSLDELARVGSGQWTGYSFAWQGNLYARAGAGEKAARALRIFSEAFCLQPNGFHVNGDQSGKGYSSFRYRPFTLEGNFAFASGLQEMLIQSHAGFIELLPAVPENWGDVSFRQLRTEGGFLVDVSRMDFKVKKCKIVATADGVCRVKMDNKMQWKSLGDVRDAKWENGFFSASVKKGAVLDFMASE